MEIAQNVVKDSAQADHKAAPPTGHPDDRYYDRTGRLTNSIRADKVRARKDIITADVLAGTPGLVEYAKDVEMGTSRSKAYPYLKPALEKNEQKILLILSQAVKRIIG